jgi:dihydroorotase
VDRLVLRGGRVLDPAQGIDAGLDVVVEDGRIVALEAPGRAAPGGQELDLEGALVVPGLVDLHGHWFEGSPYGLDPRANLRGGVTTAVDAGTAGYANFGEFRRNAIEHGAVRVLAFVHVAAAGLATTVVGELEDIRWARPGEASAVVRANRDVAVGIKVRIGTGACGRNGTSALAAALEAASLAGTPLMAHIAEGADVASVAARLRPGDVVTHALTGSGTGILGRDGLLEEVRAARRRGVVFDVGHGCGSFSWAVARRALEAGFAPDTISTDLHRYSFEQPVVDLPTTMSKFVHLGVPLADVVAAATARPAAIVGRPELGTLRPGAPADVTVLRRDPEPAVLVDSAGVGEPVAGRLRPEFTIVGGIVHRAAEVDVPLRPYLEADYEVDCAAPIGELAGSR